MDWNKFTEKMTPYMNKAKEFGKKAAEFAEDQIQMTPIFIKTQADYDNLITEKRIIIVAYDEANLVSSEVRLLSSVWITRAFMDNAKIKFVSFTESLEFARNLGLTAPLDMRVYFEGNEVYHFSTIEDIKKWWKSPVYKVDAKEPVVQTSQESPDPLAGK
ncbi:hypothetical protein K2X92_05145 [Candidatus Gracilibacteria bacterium]|nr:hypothetical protein [Candidatus Gracilibacteria bacterium]